jgi:hypothetical protein
MKLGGEIMAKFIFKLVFDNGKIFHISAKTRTKAIEKYCVEYGVCEEWVRQHCLIKNLGKGA